MSTTLVTFQVSVPSAAFVQLLGSWDNFSKPYTLERDPKVGKAAWRICPSFTNITCDGERIETEPRDGGLQMGSVYWYFYVVNNDEEIHDPSQPTTRACPFLPGQMVNVLEVPILTHTRRSSVSSMTSSIEYTLNPQDKFIPVVSEQMSPALPDPSRAPASSPRTPDPMVLHRQSSEHSRPYSRGPSTAVESVYSDAEPLLRFSSRPLSRGSQSEKPLFSLQIGEMLPESRPQSMPLHRASRSWSDWLPTRNLWSAGDAQCVESSWESFCALNQPTPAQANEAAANAGIRSIETSDVASGTDKEEDAIGDTPRGRQANPEQKTDEPSSGGLAAHIRLETALNLDLDMDSGHSDFMSTIERTFGNLDISAGPTASWADVFEGLGEQPGELSHAGLQKSHSTRSSTFFTSSNVAPTIFSQPMSPSQTEFSIDFSRSDWPVPESDAGSQQVYSLKPDEHASALTLHTLRALPDETAVTPTQPSFSGIARSPGNRKRVAEWVDHSKSTLEELREDMGYLCQLIE